MKDDIETLREFITHDPVGTSFLESETLTALDRVEKANREYDGTVLHLEAVTKSLKETESDRDSLRKILNERWEADQKAAKAIFLATGRKWGFPSNKEVVAYYIAENERLQAALKTLCVHMNTPAKE